jgi:hypothetical protein
MRVWHGGVWKLQKLCLGQADTIGTVSGSSAHLVLAYLNVLGPDPGGTPSLPQANTTPKGVNEMRRECQTCSS